MTQETTWLALQLLLSVISIAVHTCLFHLLTSSRNNHGAFFERRWKVITYSSSVCQIICGICLLVTGSINKFMSKHFDAKDGMIIIQVYILATSCLCNLFHTMTIMINDYRYAIQNNTLFKENVFYLVITWISTITCAIMLAFVDTPHDVLYVLSLIVIVTTGFIFVCYIEISRRIIVRLKRSQEFGKEYATEESTVINKSRECPKFLGVLLSASFLIFTIPFVIERIAWHQNDVLSLMCILLNSIAQGLIIIVRILLK